MNTEIKTVDLRKADGIVKMTVLANEEGKAAIFTKSEAALIAAKMENASVARDNFDGTPVYDKKGKFLKVRYDHYMVRIKK